MAIKNFDKARSQPIEPKRTFAKLSYKSFGHPRKQNLQTFCNASTIPIERHHIAQNLSKFI
ncbi:MAG: hypothetical protein CMK43_10795 [Porticoccaceae bacterium]|nr:hypothetical protein [Porticoccaceae bacterium]